MTELKFEDMTAAASGDRQNMLGKLLYFSLPSVLVDKDDLRQLCVDMNIPYAGGNRLSVSDAFRSATGDVRDRIISEEYGERRIYQIYCRDNRRISDSVISRELVKETMHQETNQYEKLANISYDKDSQIFSYALSCELDVLLVSVDTIRFIEPELIGTLKRRMGTVPCLMLESSEYGEPFYTTENEHGMRAPITDSEVFWPAAPCLPSLAATESRAKSAKNGGSAM